MGEDDEESEEDSVEEDNTSSPVLIREAMQLSFSINQLRQAEEELASLTSRQVKNSYKLSLSSQIIDIWMENQRKKGNPWTGPLLKPCKSPMHTFDDALALATKNCSITGNKSMLKFQDRDQNQSSVSPDRSWCQPSPPGNRRRLELHSDIAALEEFPNLKLNLNSTPKSCHGSPMSWDRVRNKPNTRYSPAIGLVNLFTRTGRRQKNPSSPPTQLHK
jgi:hypothetical protein